LIGIGVGWLLLNNLSGNNKGSYSDRNWQGRGRSYGAGYGQSGETNFYGESEYAGGEYTPYSSAETWQGNYPYSDERNQGIGQQVREKVGQVTSAVREKVSGISEQVSEKASELTDQIRSSTQSVTDEVQDKTSQWGAQAQHYRQQTGAQVHMVMEENAMTVGAAAFIAGAALGFVLPATRRENEMLGEWRDQVVEKAQNLASDVAQQAKEVVQEVKTEAQSAAAHVVDELAQSGKEALTARTGGNAPNPANQNTAATTTTSPANSQQGDKVTV
jgi:gas vesicle protein